MEILKKKIIKKRSLFAKFTFWLHSTIVTFWYALFLVPLSFWADKIVFHFQFTLFIIFNQFFWGFLILPWTKKYRMVCFLTTITQLLRGEDISDKKNYDHSFSQEYFKKFGINISHRMSTVITFTILFLVTIQYLSL